MKSFIDTIHCTGPAGAAWNIGTDRARACEAYGEGLELVFGGGAIWMGAGLWC